MPRRPVRASVPLDRAEHARLWRMVEGAVVDACLQHPDYLTEKGRRDLCRSVTKRVVGTLIGHAQQTLRGRRFGGGFVRDETTVSDDTPALREGRANVLGAGARGGSQTPVRTGG